MAEEKYLKNELLHIADLNSKEIFADPDLMAQFLRDYVDVEVFRDVRPEDIEDVSERYRPFLGTEFEADTVKRVRLRSESCVRKALTDNRVKEKSGTEIGMEAQPTEAVESGIITEPIGSAEGTDVYVISLVEHKSKVDYDTVMQLLKYISAIWTKYGKDHAESHKRKEFRYPPVIPIVYYEGRESWHAAVEVRDRILFGELFEKYIPNFSYHLVNIHDYENEELLSREDEMSLIMLLNKIQTPKGLKEFFYLPEERMNRVLAKAPEKLLNLIADTVWSLCRRINVPEKESMEYVEKVKEMQQMGYLFENMEKMDIQAERENTRKEKERADRLQRKVEEQQKRVEEQQRQLIQAEREKIHFIQIGIQLCQMKGNSREETISYLMGKFHLTREQAEESLQK